MHQLSLPCPFPVVLSQPITFFPAHLFFTSFSSAVLLHLASPAPHSLIALVYILVHSLSWCRVCSCSTCLPFLAFSLDVFALMVTNSSLAIALTETDLCGLQPFYPHITVIMTPKLFPFLPWGNPALTTGLMAVRSVWSVRLQSKPTSRSPRFRATSPVLSIWHMVPMPCLISLRLVRLQPPCPESTKPPAC